MRRGIGVLLLGVALLLATGCGASSAASPPHGAASPAPSRLPAGYAGGACQLLDYDVISSTVGVDFDVAAAGDNDTSFTCVLREVKADLPDLSLAVTPTMADATIFKSSVVPKGATQIGDLGKIGYSQVLNPSGGAGPAAEVGWLSGNQRILVLRYRSPSGTAAGDVSALVPKLVDLAKKIDQASV